MLKWYIRSPPLAPFPQFLVLALRRTDSWLFSCWSVTVIIQYCSTIHTLLWVIADRRIEMTSYSATRYSSTQEQCVSLPRCSINRLCETSWSQGPLAATPPTANLHLPWPFLLVHCLHQLGRHSTSKKKKLNNKSSIKTRTKSIFNYPLIIWSIHSNLKELILSSTRTHSIHATRQKQKDPAG